MKYCTYCGTELTEEVSFCPNCGAKIEREERTEAPESTLAESVFTETDARLSQRSMGIAILSFIFPVIGLILWAIWRDSQPGKSMSAAKGALVSVCCGTPIIGLIVYLVMKESQPELAKASGIAAIVGVVVTFVAAIFGFVIGFIGVLSGAEIEGGYYAFASLLGLL